MLNKLTDRIYYMPNKNDTDRPTLGVVCGDRYSLIVDSGNSPKHAREFLSELEAMDIPPVKYLAITHHHWDHTFGIGEMNLTTIAHESTKERLNKIKNLNFDGPYLEKYLQDKIFSEFAVKCIKAEFPEGGDFVVGDIDITYKDSIEIDLGGITCIIKKVGGPHTDDSSIIYIPEEKVMFMGDCGYGGTQDGVYGYHRKKLLDMIDIIESYDTEYYILSHESLCDRKEIVDFWEQLRITGQAVEESASVEEAIKRFSDTYNREPSKDEAFFIKCFADIAYREC